MYWDTDGSPLPETIMAMTQLLIRTQVKKYFDTQDVSTEEHNKFVLLLTPEEKGIWLSMAAFFLSKIPKDVLNADYQFKYFFNKVKDQEVDFSNMELENKRNSFSKMNLFGKSIVLSMQLINLFVFAGFAFVWFFIFLFFAAIFPKGLPFPLLTPFILSILATLYLEVLLSEGLSFKYPKEDVLLTVKRGFLRNEIEPFIDSICNSYAKTQSLIENIR